jgi:chromosomal replication initiator protein
MHSHALDQQQDDHTYSDALACWKEVIAAMRRDVGEATYRSWVSKMYFVSYQQGELLIAAPTRFTREWIQTHYAVHLQKYWHCIDQTIKRVSVILKQNVSSKVELVAIESDGSVSSHSTTASSSHFVRKSVFKEASNNPVRSHYVEHAEHPANEEASLALNPAFTFERFVSAPSNEVALAASKAVAMQNTPLYRRNPLVLYGPVGLGKTHLLQSIGWYIRQHSPDKKVLFLSAERFMYQFVRSLRENTMMQFKDVFSRADVLLIDDIQFMCGKESTQEEFTNIFNMLMASNGQIVCTCNRSPGDLDGLQERIRSRLSGGLVVDVAIAEYELRQRFIHQRLLEQSIEIPKESIDLLAERFTTSIRELDGALNRIIHHNNLLNKEITPQLVQKILSDQLRNVHRVVSIADVQKKTAERFGIRLPDLLSSCRTQELVYARQIAMFLSKQLTASSFHDIGRAFRKRDHTSVMHAVKKIDQLIAHDCKLADDIKLLRIALLQQ